MECYIRSNQRVESKGCHVWCVYLVKHVYLLLTDIEQVHIDIGIIPMRDSLSVELSSLELLSKDSVD
jgi:hypothetical protein